MNRSDFETDISTLKYITYVRKSDESEDRQIASTNAQINFLEKIVKELKLDVVGTLSEERSAKAPGRPVFNEMIERIQAGEADGILCWKINRLSRNPIDSGTLCWLLQQGVIKHIQPYYGRGYFSYDNVMNITFEQAKDNQYIIDLRSDVERGVRDKCERGWWPSQIKPGYLHNPAMRLEGQRGRKGRARVEQEIINDPERFALWRKVFEVVLNGQYTPPKALDVATDECGLRSPRGKPYSRSTIYRVLTDPFYYGVFEYPKGSGSWYDGAHEPMITKHEYDRIQVMLGKKGVVRPRTQGHNFTYRGIITCGECGAMVTASHKIKRQKNGNVHTYTYYHCTKRKKYISCGQRYMSEKELEKQISQHLSSISISPRLASWLVEQLARDQKKRQQVQCTIIQNHEAEIKRLTKRIDALIDMRANGELDSDEFRRKKSELELEKVGAEKALAEASKGLHAHHDVVEAQLDLAANISKKFTDGDQTTKKAILTNLGWNLSLKDKMLCVSWPKLMQIILDGRDDIDVAEMRLEPQNDGGNQGYFDDAGTEFPELWAMRDEIRNPGLFSSRLTAGFPSCLRRFDSDVA